LIRRGTAHDMGAIARVQPVSSWRPEEYLAYTLVVAEAGGKVCGFAAARPVATGEWELLEIAVAAEERRRGHGERLLQHLLHEHPGDWFLEVRGSNSGAQALYEKLGFRAISRRPGYYLDDGHGNTEEGIVFHRPA
jgi:[ribosomal protein S18]-alanine N-acetyltransferase